MSTATPPKAAAAGRVDDPVEDQQHREAAEDGDDRVERDRRLEVGVGEADHGDRRSRRRSPTIRKIGITSSASQALPPPPSTVPEKPRTPETFDAEPVEEHEDEEEDRGDRRDLLSRVQLVEFHLHIPPGSRGRRRHYTRARAAASGVDEQHRDRHRPDPAGHRRDRRRRPRAAASKSTSPQSPSSARFMPTSITTAPGLTASAPSSRGTPDRGDEDVGPAADRGEVAGARVADGDGRVRGQQQARDRHADQLRAADDDRLGALQLDPLVAQQLHHPGRRAGDEARASRGRAGRR